jgi:hypothetical protein
MKRKGVYLLWLMASLLSIGPAMSDARVHKVASIWVLSPMAWSIPALTARRLTHVPPSMSAAVFPTLG